VHIALAIKPQVMLLFLQYEYEKSLLHLRAGIDQESWPICPLQTLKSRSLIGRRIDANSDEFRLGVKALTKC
jgi:ribosome modulation factor